MDRGEECLCCHEIGPVMDKISDAAAVANHRLPLCITSHPVLREFASINGFWRLPGTTIGNSMIMDLMDQNIKGTGMLLTGN